MLARVRLLALSWLNLPCALKPAIGNGKRTLGDPPRSLPRHRGRSKAYCGSARNKRLMIGAAAPAAVATSALRLRVRVRHDLPLAPASGAAGTHIGRIRPARLAGAFCLLANVGQRKSTKTSVWPSVSQRGPVG
jgi:hypothetical protein